MEAFLAVQQLAAAAPSYPGLAQLQRELGALALRVQKEAHEDRSAVLHLHRCMPLLACAASPALLSLGRSTLHACRCAFWLLLPAHL